MPFPSPGDLPDPGIEPVLLMPPALVGRFFTISATWGAPFPGLYTYIISLDPLMGHIQGRNYFCSFTEEETEAQSIEMV